MTLTLLDVTSKIGSGATPRGGKSVYQGRGTAFLRSQNILDFSISDDGMAHISDAAADALRGVTVKSGDVLVNITGDSVARVAVWERSEMARVSQHVAIIRPRIERADPRYLQYWLAAPRQKSSLLSLSSGGGSRPALTKAMLENFPFGPHALAEQQSIARVLGALDDKIAANRRLVASADELISAIVVPRLVEECRLWDAVDFTFGEAFKGSYFTPSGSGRPLIRIRDLNSQQCQVWTTETRPREHVVENGEILVGMDAEFHAIRWSGPSGVLNQRVLLACSSVYGDPVVREILKDPLRRIERSKSGTTVIHLNKQDLQSEVANVPRAEDISRIREVVDPLWERCVAAEQESTRLAATRDELLPLLMSGKIAVRDAERLVEREV